MTEELIYLALHLREADALEIARASKLPTSVAVAWSWDVSSIRKLYLDAEEKPLAVMGVVNDGIGHGVPWMLGTDVLDTMPLYFMRESRRLLRHLQSKYTSLSNYVDAEYEATIRWLECLDFDIDEAEPYGPYGFPFRKFSWRKN